MRPGSAGYYLQSIGGGEDLLLQQPEPNWFETLKNAEAMTWLEHHQASELAASEAHAARRGGDSARADQLFEAAARAELEALKHLSLEQKPRTFAITAVSCAALLYKAARPQEAELFAHSMLSRQGLPDFATDQLREILQSIWNEQAQAAAGVRFVQGQVTVSVDGGEVVKGGAPLCLRHEYRARAFGA